MNNSEKVHHYKINKLVKLSITKSIRDINFSFSKISYKTGNLISTKVSELKIMDSIYFILYVTKHDKGITPVIVTSHKKGLKKFWNR